MGLFRKRKPPPGLAPETRDEAFGHVVSVSSAVTWERDGEGLVKLRYPVAVRPWFAGLARRLGQSPDATRIKTLELDALGSTVWGWIDNRRTVGQLAELLAAEYNLHHREAEVAMAAFVRELGMRGIVALTP